MNKNLLYLLGGGVLIAVVAFVGLMLFSGSSDEAGSYPLPPEEGAPLEQIGGEATVRMTTNGFVPQTASVVRGTAVIFVNESPRPMWPASAVHPTHQLLPGFDALRDIAPGESYRYTFERSGRFSYHDHLAPNVTGVIVVN